MAARYAKENFTVGSDFVWLGSLRDSASATVVAYPAGFSVTPTVPAGSTLGDYLQLRPAGP
jgi:hypothetical protein